MAWHFYQCFEIGGKLSLLSQHLLNFQCLIEGSSDASVFYLTRTLWAILPLMIVLGCILIWSIIAVFGTMCGGKCCCKCSKDLFYYEIFNPYERIKLSCVTILYFIYPTLVQETFNLMSCRKGKQMKRGKLYCLVCGWWRALWNRGVVEPLHTNSCHSLFHFF